MGLFHKKVKEVKDVPIDEVSKMTKKGMSDKDIIKHLKSKGYSYEAIESAMLKAVKDNVDDTPRQVETEPPAMNDIFEMPHPEYSQPTQMEAMPDFGAEIEQPEVMLEELIEGIVEDKWRKFDDRLKKIDDNFDKIRAEIKQFEVKLDQNRRESPTHELDGRMADISDQLEDLEARVGGLEKAFKQFLPSLTRNIESLSHMIHDMKDKQAMHEEEI
ncbi:MAG: hypothetical protein HY517_02970 [Candidatus Aenigmarchaeota archaeon]|nr:hypothetical protein [Candidatus Aenigmarchaeota archaeon]